MKQAKKNLFLISLALFWGVLILGISTIRVSGSEAMKQNGIDEKAIVEEGNLTGGDKLKDRNDIDLLIKDKKGEKVDYYLPYPGILPDHTLYWLKMIRDKVILSLTRSPLGRLEKLLLYADKRIGAAKVLIEGRKFQLGVGTATKAEKYLGQVVNQTKEVKKTGKLSPELKEKLIKAVLKHEEILTGFLDQIPDSNKQVIEESIKQNKQNLEVIKNQFD